MYRYKSNKFVFIKKYSFSAKCMPIFGHTFFGHNSAIFGPIGQKIVMQTQENIIYPSYDAYFSVLIFWATFGGKIGVATTHAPYGLGPSNLTKKLAH